MVDNTSIQSIWQKVLNNSKPSP